MTRPLRRRAGRGSGVLLAEAERWAEGRYLAVDLLVVAERRDEKRGGEIDRVAAMLVGRRIGCPTPTGNIWWTTVLEDSVKHTVGVSKDLREGIRLSIEIIANDVVRRRADNGGPAADQIEQAQQLAKHSLRFLYRILFLLYAEASPELRGAAVGRSRVRRGLRTGPAARADPDRARLTRSEKRHPPLRVACDAVPAWSTTVTPRDGRRSPTTRPRGLEFNALRADLFARRRRR